MSQGPHAIIAQAIAIALEPHLRTIVREELQRILSAPVVDTKPEHRPQPEQEGPPGDRIKDGRRRPFPGQRSRQGPVPESGPLTASQAHLWLLKEHNIVIGKESMTKAMKARAIKGATWDPHGSSRGMGMWRCDREAVLQWAKSMNLQRSPKGFWRLPIGGYRPRRGASASKKARSSPGA